MRKAHLAPLAVLAAASCQARAGEPRPPRALLNEARPIVFAHRGGGGEAPESTVEAFVRAARDPRVALEMDVRRTKDDALVVIHDARIDRTTRGRGRVADLTLAELGRATDGVVPTLDAVLDALPADRLVSIELKDPGAEALLAARLRARGRLARLLVGAEDDESAARLRTLLPEATHYFPRRAATCLVTTGKVGAGDDLCSHWDVLAAPTSALGLDLGTPAMIERLHARGIPVVYFTVNDEATMERLFRAGADGLYTDHPTRALRVLERLGARR